MGRPGESPEPAPPEAPAVAQPDADAASAACDRVAKIDVWKADRALIVSCAGGAELRWTAAIGREPSGDKRVSGDLRTPEGRYQIAGAIEPSRFHGFIPIDYPSLDDADRALAEGRLSSSDRDRIAAAHERGEMPPADTPLGGRIGIHGEGPRWSGESELLDWTYGCIAITDAQLDFLAPRVSTGVIVEIHP